MTLGLNRLYYTRAAPFLLLMVLLTEGISRITAATAPSTITNSSNHTHNAFMRGLHIRLLKAIRFFWSFSYSSYSWISLLPVRALKLLRNWCVGVGSFANLVPACLYILLISIHLLTLLFSFRPGFAGCSQHIRLLILSRYCPGFHHPVIFGQWTDISKRACEEEWEKAIGVLSSSSDTEGTKIHLFIFLIPPSEPSSSLSVVMFSFKCPLGL